VVIDLELVTGRIDQTDPGLEIVQLKDLQLEVETDQVRARARDRDQALEPGQAHAQAQVQDQVLELGQVHGQARVQDQVREPDQVHAQVQWTDQGQDQVRDKVVPGPVVEVPWADTRTGALLPGTVNVVDPVVPAAQAQDHPGVRRAGVGVEADQRAEVVDVAEAEAVAAAVVAAEAAVDVNLKWP